MKVLFKPKIRTRVTLKVVDISRGHVGQHKVVEEAHVLKGTLQVNIRVASS